MSMNHRWLLAMGLILGAASPARPAAPKVDAGAVLDALASGNTAALAAALRGALLQAIPSPLYEKYDNWNKTDRVANGLKWDGLKPQIQYKNKNDGKWKHLRAEAINPAAQLTLDIRDLRQPAPGRITFNVFLSCPIRFEYRLLTWERGIKLWDRSYRARCRVLAQLHCEAAFRVEPAGLLPDLVYRLRVSDAQVSYDDFVMEHAAGVGGEAAELMGEIGLRNVKRFKPSLERDLLSKANAAIEKAADTREVRVSLQELLKKNGWWPGK